MVSVPSRSRKPGSAQGTPLHNELVLDVLQYFAPYLIETISGGEVQQADMLTPNSVSYAQPSVSNARVSSTATSQMACMSSSLR